MARDPGPAGADAAVPERRRRLVVLPEAGAEGRARLAGDVDREHAERHDVARAGRRRPRAHRVGGEPRVPRASTCGRTSPPTTSTPTSCASTSTRSPGVGFDEVRVAARELQALLDELGIRGWPKTTGNRGIHVYMRLEPRWTPIEVRAGRGRGGARAGAPPPRRDHRRVVEGGARRAGLRRLQPERAAQDGVRRVVGAGPRRRAGVDAVRRGTSSTTSIPRRARWRPCPARVDARGDPWADIDDDPQLLDAAARDVRPRPRSRASRTRRGRPSTRRCRASHPGSRPAGRARTTARQAGRQEAAAEAAEAADAWPKRGI